MKLLSFRYSICWLLILGVSSCLPPIEKEYIFQHNFDDPESRLIQDYADKMQSDSLLPYLSHANPNYRYIAARGFAKSRDTRHLDTLISLLADEHPQVRTMAAFAMGQLKDPAAERPLVEAFVSNDSTGIWNEFNAVVLEAIGKCGSLQNLKHISSVRTYLPSDTIILEGQCHSIYQYALRGITDSVATEKMLEYVYSNLIPNEARFIAANYLSRARNLTLDSAAIALSKVFRTDRDPRIRMSLAIALGKTGDPAAIPVLQQQFEADRDYRVRVNIIRALPYFAYWQVKPIVLKAFDDENIHVRNALATFLKDNGNPQEAYWYLQKGRQDTLHWNNKISLYRATLKTLPLFYYNSKARISAELQTIFQSSNNNYEKAASLEAMAEFFPNYPYIREQGYASIVPVIRSSAVRSLAYIATHPEFELFYRRQSETVKKELVQYLLEAINSNDAGMISEASIALVSDTTGLIDLIEDANILTGALDRLELQQDQEAWLNLSKAIAKLEGEDIDKVQLPIYTGHRIDWELLNQSCDTCRVVIRMNKGAIKVELFPYIAPGSVANFLSLAKEGYYNRKYIHRVVPNFVIQGGCDRGDGYGSPEYSIRSEFERIHYDRAGYVGMASVGNHTEGTQWFITHSPTLHLDGNYTIFGRVVEGMDLVHDIQIGDQIEQISITE